MRIVEADNRRLIGKYMKFVRKLYEGDSAYVCTQMFNARSLLLKKSQFARSCFIRPVLVMDANSIVAVCTFIHNSKLPYLQIALFDAIENAQPAVDLLVSLAKSIARERNLHKILVGINGHLSYGVGILEENFGGKMSFDSLYNKSYYKSFFAPHISSRHQLCTYRASIDTLLQRVRKLNLRSSITIRESNLKNFTDEAERLRNICDRTLIRTSFYYPTDEQHFSELMGGLTPFLHNENLLFAENNGECCGFLFWHPDYNALLKGGHNHSLLSIFLNAKKAIRAADTLKINAIASTGHNIFTTAALIVKLERYLIPSFKFIETTFVWDDNIPSRTLCLNLFSSPYRKYAVYTIDV